MVTRRRFLQAGMATVLLARTTLRPERTILDPRSISKYVQPLVVPPVMPAEGDGPVDRYVIGARRFRQQILPPDSPATTVWGYGSVRHPRTFATPAWTLEARAGRPVQVTWVNELVDQDGDYLPPLLPVDPTLHWAHPGGGPSGRDSRPEFTSTPSGYRGPVPIVTHLHGGHSPDDSDGHPEAWYLPAARNTPVGYATVGSRYAAFAAAFRDREGVGWQTGSAVYSYPNDQAAGALWYHDHALGLTRLNIYAGLAGFYLLRGGSADLPAGVLPGPAPQPGDAPGTRYREIPILIQDRSFTADGSLLYPASRDVEGFAGPYIPHSDVPPMWVPEFFGTTMVVNGRTWPVLEVAAARYRLRLLNVSNARFLVLSITADPPERRPVRAAMPFWQIGSDAAFLPAPVELARLLLAPAERADVVVDFSGFRPGTALYLVNEGPDAPFPGGADRPPADPRSTGQVMKFVVRPATDPDHSVPPDQLTLPTARRLGPAERVRRLALVEQMSRIPDAGPVAALLGVLDGQADGRATARLWGDPVTENPTVGTTEIWEFHNFTEDAHPIHLHEIQFEVVDRRPLPPGNRPAPVPHGRHQPAYPALPPPQPPQPWERGFKDTVIAHPEQVTRIKALFDRAGSFVWHCHMLEHEDNEMMRPYRIEP